MVKELDKSSKQRRGGKPKKDQGHEFRCIPKTVAGIFRECLDKNPEKRALVEEMGFGVLSNLPNYYLKQKVLKELFNHFDIYDNTIHAVTGEVEITTKKIGDALGTPFPDKVVPKELGDEDFAVYKFFQGKTQAQLGKLIMDTPVDTVENKRLSMRAFLLFIQKSFLLATFSTNVTPRAYPTLYDVENTKQRNWALHVHNFLLEESKKDKENKTKEHIAQPPWIHYWNGRTLWDRMKQEKQDAAGLVRTGKLRAEKERKQKKNPKKSASSESEWESESETDTEGYVPDESEEDSDSEETRSKELVQRNTRPEPNPAQEERRSKKMHESNNATEGFSGLQQSEDHRLAETIKRIRKRKNEEKEERNNKKKKQPDGKSPTKSANVEPEHEPPQQPHQLEEETPIQQPQPQPQQQPHQDDVIEISSCSDDEQPPDHMEVLHPLVPKVEELQEDQPPRVLEQPSQTVVEVVPIYPTQEIIDVSSGSEDERQPLIPKTEEYHVYSPSARIITEVLMSMNRKPQ
ncbi:hypothetical protein PIB30_076900 [Stylosanthes scabra]|uniref:Uncharacterized protein n=1 Tax=Stylosanthes scabra TaxID=79078 RepID=A0ABU6WQ92_9FABA|nr:hypothetical protein [Stylosanthes scabra]